MSRILRRAILPSAVLFALVLYWFYGTLRVPVDMDTMQGEYPPGTVCLIYKRPGRVAAGSVVFVDLPGGGTLLTRVESVDADGIIVRHDNPASRFPDGEELEPLPFAAVRGLVLTSFVPDALPREERREGGR